MEIYQAINKAVDIYQPLINLNSNYENESPDILIMKKYFFLNEMLATLLTDIGNIGKAMQGEEELNKHLINVAAVCVKWLEENKKPLA